MRVFSYTGGYCTQLGDGSFEFVGVVPDFLSTAPVFKPAKNPNIGAEIGSSVDIQKVDFGHGYSQRGRKGLNSTREEMPVSWSQLDANAKNALVSFFEARAGVECFVYGLPGDRPRLWIAPKWSRGLPQSPLLWMVSAAFQRVYDPLP